VPDEDDEVAKVLDFGIAKIKAAPGEMGLSTSTKTGAVLGTPYYMAPEQARGLRTIDTRADLWSLGVIAYKCVTGVLPFEGESVGDLLVKICTSAPPVPSATVPGLPAAFDAWFARALEREPEKRFQSASELAEALALAAGVTVRRGPMSSQPGRSPPTSVTPPNPDARTPQPALPSAALTAGDFVTSARAPKSSRGVFITVAVTALLGGSLGVLLVIKLLGPAHEDRPLAPSATPIAAASPAPAPSVIPSAALAALPTSDPPPGPSASAAPTSKPKPGGAPRPGSAVSPTKPPSSKPPSNSSDPGY
jgi:serine/threonine-protein kinase